MAAKQCCAKHPTTDEPICSRDVDNPSDGLCIFHTEKKQNPGFIKRFVAEVKRVNESKEVEVFDGRGFIFPKSTTLNGLSFTKRVYFDQSKFEDHVTFKKVDFECSVSFHECRFGNDCKFIGVGFLGESIFYAAQFGSFTLFGATQFRQRGIFQKTRFGDHARFVGVEIHPGTTFREAIFGDHPQFFSEESRTIFGDNVDFYRTEFGRETRFENVEFGNHLSFTETIFGDRTQFKSNSFGSHASFSDSGYGDGLRFEDAKFGDKLDFSGARFSDKAVFKNISFDSHPENTIAKFTDIYLSRPGQLILQKVDLKVIAFSGSEVQYFEIIQCNWPEINRRKVVFDEIYRQRHLKSGSSDEAFLEPATLNELAQLYRRLQLGLEDSKRYPAAGDFYVGRMEASRKAIGNDANRIWRWLRQNVLGLSAAYRILSQYGQSWGRTVIWIFLTIVIFPCFYLLAGFNYPEQIQPDSGFIHVDYELGRSFELSIGDYFKALYISFHSFTFQRNTPYFLSIEGRVIAVFESAISAILLAFLLLAIRRGFKR